MCGTDESYFERQAEEQAEGRAVLLDLITDGKPYVLVTATMSEEDEVPTLKVETNAGSEEYNEVAAWMLRNAANVFVPESKEETVSV